MDVKQFGLATVAGLLHKACDIEVWSCIVIIELLPEKASDVADGEAVSYFMRSHFVFRCNSTQQQQWRDSLRFCCADQPKVNEIKPTLNLIATDVWNHPFEKRCSESPCRLNSLKSHRHRAYVTDGVKHPLQILTSSWSQMSHIGVTITTCSWLCD